MLRKIVIAGVTSGVGKTTVALAVMHGLIRKGLKVQPFKIGPDFIDPSYHTFVTNRASRNLDFWMMGKQGVLQCFTASCKDTDVAVIEGVMGLFDGMYGKKNLASTAHVAKILNAPVILVVDAGKGAQSIAAVILGFLHYDKSVRIAGVILNNVSGKRHASYIIDAFAGKVKVPVVGIVQRNNEIRIEERHLGLVPTPELEERKRNVIVAGTKYVSDQIDIDKILVLCRSQPLPNTPASSKRSVFARVAVALDESFNFYYPDNLDALRKSGADLIFFSPVNQHRLPEGVDGIILGGGFPEVLADRLEKNLPMLKSIKKAVLGGMPVYGECGGLMYLTRSISGYKGEKKERKMAGLVDADTVMTNKLTLNYTEAECTGHIFGKTRLRGHEFHYSSIENIATDSIFAYSMTKGMGMTGNKDGLIVNGTGLAAYTHLHFANQKLSEGLVKTFVRYSRR